MQMLKKLFKKLFNSDKKYYLELDELKDSEVVQTAVKTAEKTAQVVKEKAAEVAQSEPVKEAAKTVSEVVDTAQDKVASAIATEEKPSKQKAKATEAKNSKSKAAKNGKSAAKDNQVSSAKGKNQETKPAKTAAQNGASSFDPPFWVAAMNNTNKSTANGNGVLAGETFAEDNLMPTVTKYRRRPGGSLAKFRDMAKSARTPRK